MNIEEKTAGDSMKEIRKSVNMTQREFSQHFGIPIRTLQNWENGVNVPPEYTVNMIRRLLMYEKLLLELGAMKKVV